MTLTAPYQDLPASLPIFPLRGALLLPRGQLPLNIFEPRYLAMIDTALSDRRLIGMVRPQQEGGVTKPELYQIGCAGRITSFMETDDGRYLITLTGISRFHIKRELETSLPFRLIEPSWAQFRPDLVEPAPEDGVLRERLLETLAPYLEDAGLSADWKMIEHASAETIVNSVAMNCPFNADEKQALLEAETMSDRAETLLALMQMAAQDTTQDHSAKSHRLQ